MLLVVTVGQYAPPAGLKTKLKGSWPSPRQGAGLCSTTPTPIDTVSITNHEELIAQQV